MKTAIGTVSNSDAPRVATVWKMKEPMPIAKVTPISISAGQSRLPSRRHCTKATAAAIRNETFVKALSGSAQNDGPSRSQ